MELEQMAIEQVEIEQMSYRRIKKRINKEITERNMKWIIKRITERLNLLLKPILLIIYRGSLVKDYCVLIV